MNGKSDIEMRSVEIKISVLQMPNM